MNYFEKETLCRDCDYSIMRSVFTDNDYCKIEKNRGEMNFSPNDIILKQGTFVSQVLYLKTGLAKIVIEGKKERDTILQIIEGENFIALPVLGNPEIYPYSVIAITDCTLCAIRKETMIEIMTQNEAANKFLLKTYHTDYIYLFNRIAIMSTRNNHGKLASALLYLSNGNFKNNVLEKISRKELSQLASISIESTNKILIELKNDGLIDIKNNNIRILKPELLKKLSTVG